MMTLQPTRAMQAARPAPRMYRGNGEVVASRARIAAADGISLHYRVWQPATQTVNGALVFVHGIASHGAWFSQTAGFLARSGIAVYAPDRRGSGLSGGARGHADSVEQLLTDLDVIVTRVEAQQPAVPLFLAGSSWSAKLALAFAAKAQGRLAGLLLHGPGLFPKVDLSFRQKLAVLVCHRLQPGRQLPIPLVPESYTDQPAYLGYIQDDPYRLLTASARFFWETRQLDRARNRLAARLTLPVLLQIGDADAIMDTTATCRWFQDLSAPDRTAITYANAAHTLDFEAEPTVEAYRTDLLGWLRRQIGDQTEHRTRSDTTGHTTLPLDAETATESSNGR